MDVQLSNRRTIVHLFSPLKCTPPKLIPFPHRIQIGFESTVHVDGIDGDICPVFQDVIQDDIGWDKHIPLFQLFGKLVDGFDGNLDYETQVLSCTRFFPMIRFLQFLGIEPQICPPQRPTTPSRGSSGKNLCIDVYGSRLDLASYPSMYLDYR